MTGPVTKYGHHLSITPQDLEDTSGLRADIGDLLSGKPPTPEQTRARIAVERARHARIASLHQHHATLVASLTGTPRAVAELHAVDDDGGCTGCDYEGHDAERPAWPCRTIDTIEPSADQRAST